MGVQCDIIVADLSEAESVATSDTPTRDREGFTFNGLHNVQLCTLLSLLESGSPQQHVDKHLDAIRVVSSEEDAERGVIVHAIREPEVTRLATIAQMEDDEINPLAHEWGKTEEFEGWIASDVSEVLRLIGDLAESAVLQDKLLLLWTSL